MVEESTQASSIQKPIHDRFLQTLVDLANVHDAGFKVILTVKGFLVCGELVSGEAYFNWFCSRIRENNEDKGAAEMLAQGFEEFAKPFQRLREGDEPADLPQYVHLRSVKIVLPGTIPVTGLGNDEIWWRGRVDSVDGFTFGDVTASA